VNESKSLVSLFDGLIHISKFKSYLRNFGQNVEVDLVFEVLGDEHLHPAGFEGLANHALLPELRVLVCKEAIDQVPEVVGPGLADELQVGQRFLNFEDLHGFFVTALELRKAVEQNPCPVQLVPLARVRVLDLREEVLVFFYLDSHGLAEGKVERVLVYPLFSVHFSQLLAWELVIVLNSLDQNQLPEGCVFFASVSQKRIQKLNRISLQFFFENCSLCTIFLPNLFSYFFSHLFIH